MLDRIAGHILYKNGCAIMSIAHREERLSMLTSWTYKEHTPKQPAYAGMGGVCLRVGLSLSSVNIFGGRLGQETSIDSRHTRH
jgi:hypothetical protein